MLGFTGFTVEVENLADVRTHGEGKHTHSCIGLEETIRRSGEFDELLCQVEGVGFIGVLDFVLHEPADLVQWMLRCNVILPSEVFVYTVLKEVRHVHGRTFTVVTDVRLGVE